MPFADFFGVAAQVIPVLVLALFLDAPRRFHSGERQKQRAKRAVRLALWAELLTLGALLLSSSVTLEGVRAVDPVLAIALRTFYFALIGFALFVITWLLSQISQLLVAALDAE